MCSLSIFFLTLLLFASIQGFIVVRASGNVNRIDQVVEHVESFWKKWVLSHGKQQKQKWFISVNLHHFIFIIFTKTNHFHQLLKWYQIFDVLYSIIYSPLWSLLCVSIFHWCWNNVLLLLNRCMLSGELIMNNKYNDI